MRRFSLILLAAALAVACDDGPTTPTTPAPPAAADDESLLTDAGWHAHVRGAAPVRLLQQNAYPGFSIDKVEAAIVNPDPAVALGALTNGLLVFESTDWRARAARLAREVARQQPDVITLNEMVTVVRQGFRDVAPALVGTPFEPFAEAWATIPNDSTVFLPVLLEELARLGLHYVVVGELPLTNVYVPIPIPGVPEGFVHARYIDTDVLLARATVDVEAVAIDTFDVMLATPLGAQTRGWIAADLRIRGKPWRVVATHPEPSWPVAAGQTPQVTQLLAALAGGTRPTLVAGDLNFLPASAQYAEMQGAGFTDLWTRRLGLPLAEETCCRQDETLRSSLTDDPLTERKDYVWVRPDAGRRVGPVRFTLFGDQPWERTPSGLWVSDHLGLPVGLVLVPAH